MRHGVPWIARQGLSEHLFRFLIAILDQQCPGLAKTAEAGLTSGRRRAAKTADRLVTMAQCVYQGTSAEPSFGERWEQLSGAIVGNDSPADVALLLQGNSQAEVCIGVARVAGDGPLQCGDGIRHITDLEAGEAQIVLDGGIERL